MDMRAVAGSGNPNKRDKGLNAQTKSRSQRARDWSGHGKGS